jgi:transcriptional regulator with XRE-family HTH domain
LIGLPVLLYKILLHTVIFGSLDVRLRQLREQKGLTQKALADKLQMSIPYLSNLEKGKANVSLYTMRRLAKALKVRVADLVADE